MSPKAGAHGELCGLLCIRAALEARGDKREVVLVPESAHGTNPATAAFAGYRVENIPANAAGRVDLEALKARLGPDVAAVMITNPNTCGLFEPDMKAISDAVHAAGALRLLRRRELQRDRRQGPPGRPRHRCDAHQPAQDLLDAARRRRAGCGSGRASARRLRRSRRCRSCEKQDGSFVLVEEETAAEEHHARASAGWSPSTGRWACSPRAASYMLSHGADGLRQVAEDAVLNANYILRSARGRARRAVRRRAGRACTKRSSPTAVSATG